MTRNLTNAEVVWRRRANSDRLDAEFAAAAAANPEAVEEDDMTIVLPARLVPQIVGHSWRADACNATRVCKDSAGYSLEIGGAWWALPINP